MSPTPSPKIKQTLPAPPEGYQWRLSADPQLSDYRLHLTLTLFNSPSNSWSADRWLHLKDDELAFGDDDTLLAVLRPALLGAARDILVARRLIALGTQVVNPVGSRIVVKEKLTLNLDALDVQDQEG